jgi:hypothetical protein
MSNYTHLMPGVPNPNYEPDDLQAALKALGEDVGAGNGKAGTGKKTGKEYGAERATARKAAGLTKWEQPLADEIARLDSALDAKAGAWSALDWVMTGSPSTVQGLANMTPGDTYARTALRGLAKLHVDGKAGFPKKKKPGATSSTATGKSKATAKPEAPKSGTKETAASGSSKDDPDAVLAEFNTHYAVVNEAAKSRVYAERYDRTLKRYYHDRMSFDDFRNLNLNRYVADGDRKPAAPWWLRHPDRREYLGGVVFDPTGQHAANELNLWRGFNYEPKQGDWSLMRDHIRDVVCGGNEKYFTYLMGWLAYAVQHPERQGEVAVVMRGVEGCGKGTLARAFCDLFGQHGLHISNAKHLVGAFNQHLEGCVALFADEAFFAGDKQHVSVLKAIITEPHLTIEGKYRNATQAPNRLHIMMASNDAWVVPASLEARRFFVLDVLDTVKNDQTYFGRIWDQMEAGGYAAMLHDLLAYDLTGFNVRKPPVTEALQDQKRLSLTGPHAWWLDVLERGYVKFPSNRWGEWETTTVLYDAYLEHEKQRQERRPKSREALGKFLRSVGAVPAKSGPKGSQRPGYRLGKLAYARIAFCDATGLAAEWSDEPDAPDEPMTDDADLNDLLNPRYPG